MNKRMQLQAAATALLSAGQALRVIFYAAAVKSVQIEASIPGKMTDYLHLRPHHLLCLLSFSGKGYSPQFIEQLKKIQQTFFSRETRIEISPGTDDVCEICPERAGDCCGRLIGITDNELDRRVRQTLGIESGQYLAEVLWRTLARSYHEELGYQICEGCTWLAEGNCPAKIVQRLHGLLDETPGKIDGIGGVER